MNQDKTENSLKYTHLARVAEVWMHIYVGVGIGIGICEAILYSLLGHLTMFSFASLGAFAFALLNYHMREWAKRKADSK